MKHILVTTDFSKEAESAFDYVRQFLQLFKADGVRCTLLTVLEDLAQKNVHYQFALKMLEKHGIREDLYQEATRRLEEVLHASFPDLPVTTTVVRARKAVHREIIDYARANDVDLIVIATHGRTGVQQLLLGSVSEKVIREAKLPVLVVPVSEDGDPFA
jgi:nucleotide-binding universal stress UspA family protein